MKLPRRGPGEDLTANRSLRYEDAQKAEQGTIERRLRHGCTERANYPGRSFTGCKGRVLLTHRNLFGRENRQQTMYFT
jgi:hypothetical protein